jgi:pimeloyl-ACP methyl ester carboxylesterase
MRLLAILAMLAGGLGTVGTVGTASADASADGSADASGGGLVWDKCADVPDAMCTTVTVPLDYAEPSGRTIEIAISRIKATGEHRRGVLLGNPGGPGGSGLGYLADLRSLLGDAGKQYDLIGFDPRFVGASNPIDCGPTRAADVFRSPGVDRAGFKESERISREFAAACHERNPGILAHAGIRNVARDMDRIREALGERKLSYYGVSWGADLGVVYSQLFGDRVDRLVIDSVTDVEGSEYHHLRTGERTEAGLDEWAAWAAWRHEQYGLGRTGFQVRETISRLQAYAARKPIRVGEYRVDDNALPFILRTGLGHASDYPDLAEQVRDLVDAAAGKPVAPSEFLKVYYTPSPEIDRFAAASFAFTCNDGGWPTDLRVYWRDVQRSRDTQPFFGPNITPCAFWRDVTSEPPLVVGNDVPMLIVQAERDDIPLVWAQRLHRKLTGSRLVTIDSRAHGVYDERYPSIVSTVNEYLS